MTNRTTSPILLLAFPAFDNLAFLTPRVNEITLLIGLNSIISTE